MKHFRFLIFAFLILAPSGSWAAWPGKCTWSAAAGHVIDYAANGTLCDSVSLDPVTGDIVPVGCVYGQIPAGTNFYNVTVMSFYFETNGWIRQGFWGGWTRSIGGIQLVGIIANQIVPPAGTCGPPPDPCQDEVGNPAGKDCDPPVKPEPPYNLPKNFGLTCPRN